MSDSAFKRPTNKTICKWIASRARRMGLRRQDIEDAQQQILMVLMDFQFDPERSNGASSQTAITAIIDRQLRTYKRTKTRYAEHVTGSENIPNDLAGNTSGSDIESQISMLADVTAARSTLCEVSQRICDALAQGQSINEIAQSLNMSWHTVRKHIDAIRERFIEVGLGSDSCNSF